MWRGGVGKKTPNKEMDNPLFLWRNMLIFWRTVHFHTNHLTGLLLHCFILSDLDIVFLNYLYYLKWLPLLIRIWKSCHKSFGITNDYWLIVWSISSKIISNKVNYLKIRTTISTKAHEALKLDSITNGHEHL